MKILQLAVVTGAIALLTCSESQAQSIEPANGYAVQTLVVNIAKNQRTGETYLWGNNYWWTVETFATQRQAEYYKDFLYFLSFRDLDKLFDEVDAPSNIFVHGSNHRVIPLYSREQLFGTQMLLRR